MSASAGTELPVASRGGDGLETRKSRLYGEKFVKSPVGVLKILETVVCLLATVFFLLSPCTDRLDWHQWLFPAATITAIGCTTLTFVVYVMGLATQRHRFCKLDITLNLIIALVMLICTILTLYTSCGSQEVYSEVPTPAGFVSVGLLVTSAAVTYVFMMWEKQENEMLMASPPDSRRDQQLTVLGRLT